MSPPVNWLKSLESASKIKRTEESNAVLFIDEVGRKEYPHDEIEEDSFKKKLNAFAFLLLKRLYD